jgi:hypothetical protein
MMYILNNERAHPSNTEEHSGWENYEMRMRSRSKLIPGKITLGGLNVTCPRCGEGGDVPNVTSAHGLHLCCDECGLHVQPFGNTFYAWKE